MIYMFEGAGRIDKSIVRLRNNENPEKRTLACGRQDGHTEEENGALRAGDRACIAL